MEERILTEMLTEGLTQLGAPLHHEDREAVARVARHLRSGGATLMEHARWKVACGRKVCECSGCGEHFDNTCNLITEDWKYCPNCGAQMDLGGGEDD